MKTQKTKLTPIPASIYEILLLNKGGVVPDEILIRHVYGDELNIVSRMRSIRNQISAYVRPFALINGYKIEKLKNKGFIMSGVFEGSKIEPKLSERKKIVVKKPLKIIMYDRVECTDTYGTFEELAVLIDRSPLTTERSFYGKKWCGKRYYFRQNENDTIPRFVEKTPTVKAIKDIKFLKSYQGIICEKKENHKGSGSIIQIDERTRIISRS